jgi:hypothetical protein
VGYILKRKLFLFAMLLLAFIVIITVYVNTNCKKISSIVGFQGNDITRISSVYDNPGIKGGTVENKEKIKELMKYINSCVVIKKLIQTPITGYSPMFIFLIGDKQVMNMTVYDNCIEINGIQYNMVKDKISLQKIIDFIK